MTKICAFAFLCFSLISMSAFVQVKSDSTDSTDTTAPTTATTTQATTQPSGVTLTTTSCNATQLQHATTSDCKLTCSLKNFDDNSDFVMYSSDFYYYTTDSDDAVRITFNDEPSSSVSYPLTSNYYAGTYECRMSYRVLSANQLMPLNAKFKIATDNASSALGDSCTTRQRCATLNADCIDGECKCPDLYYIKFSKGDDNPACLAPYEFMTDYYDYNTKGCNVDAQCQDIDNRLRCANGRCIADGSYNKMLPADVAYITLATIAVVLGICAIILSTIRKK